MFIDNNGKVRKPVAYLAGFEMFLPDGYGVGERHKAICDRYGIVGLYPTDPIPDDGLKEYVPKDDSLAEFEKKIMTQDVNHVRRSDMIIANLNDFRRGQEPDSGTCFECGAAYACGKRLYCFIDNADTMINRFSGEKHLDENGKWVDKDGYTIENFDLPLNLMFSVPFTVVEGTFEDAVKRARADFDAELEAAGYPPYEIKE